VDNEVANETGMPQRIGGDVALDARALAIPGVWEFTPAVDEGHNTAFAVPFSAPEFVNAVGHLLPLGHMNVAVTRAGILRGIHYGDVPPGQAKYITCVAGSVWDVAVDLRLGSPTFGQYVGTLLDGQKRRAIYIGEGLGHGYICLEDRSILVYICSQPYNAEREHRLFPLDESLGIAWPKYAVDGSKLEVAVGRRDRSAPSLREALDAGLLPTATRVGACIDDRISSYRTWQRSKPGERRNWL
jgi:dTDP-4-dehydrorhamnose 3,5-epimerase